MTTGDSDETPARAEPSTPGNMPRPAKDQAIKELKFDDLSGGLDMVLIKHGDEVYQLKLTRFGKLLLNK